MNAPLSRTLNFETPGRFSDWPLALKSILGFWIFYALTVVARALLGADAWTMLINKLVVIAIGILLTGLVYVVIASFTAGASIRKKVVVAGLASVAAAWGMAGAFLLIEDFMKEPKEVIRYQSREGFVIIEKGRTLTVERRAQEPLVVTFPNLGELDANKRLRFAADTAVVWLFFFMAWSAFYLATVAQAEALNARRRAVEAESEARAAQVRALRYQINPHFLFNTLNSLSSLVMSGRPDEAESMILKLSTFFRSGLSLDPSADVTLEEEIALQRLYLDIEKVRFPRRLKVEIDIPKDLENARVPALILQPLVENAIKYGVSGSRETVTLEIRAAEAGPGRFTIEVVNSAGTAAKKRRGEKPDGTGVGLGNVCQRLEARFGPAAKCEFGPTADGGYRVLMTLPLDRADG
ncbi:histidine kinase [Sphingomonas sp. SM33]|uniref:Histidine kinase n=1 Tax=Sphingomonas telluris TaxID=2907998 RepID=A0ABS9VMH1_9SPHN|nr:histidine kinase [Sphingomonas telluris]MCH8615744.1 histidine kinase [Sphingomonas telluris]